MVTWFTMPSITHAASCTNYLVKDVPTSTGYGAAYNLFSTNHEQLVKTTSCADTSIGIMGNDNQSMYVYNQRYVWIGPRWIQLAFLSQKSSLIGCAWYTGSAAAGSGDIYYVGYTYQQVSGIWKCGCRDESCVTPGWELQKVKASEAGGGSYPGIGANLNDFGAKNLSVAPPADAVRASGFGSLEAAQDAAGGKVLYIDPGTYSGDLNVNGPTRVIAYGATLHGTLSVSGSTVEGITVTGGPSIHLGSDGKLKNCTLTGGGQVKIDHASNFTVDHCTIDGSQAGYASIEIIFSHGGMFTNNLITNSHMHGVEWWGGNSANLGSASGVSDLTFIGNVVKHNGPNNGGGAIWGSMGDHVTIEHNTVEECGDVCIDTEGGKDHTIKNNSCHNGKNGCVTFFYEASDIVVDHNEIVQDAGYDAGVKSYGTGVHHNVHITNNIITTTHGSQGILIPGYGPIDGLTTTGNDITLKVGNQGIFIDSGSSNITNTGNTVH